LLNQDGGPVPATSADAHSSAVDAATRGYTKTVITS
jgi:hypothetical protein